MALSQPGDGAAHLVPLGDRREQARVVPDVGIALPAPRPSARPPPARRPSSAPRMPARTPRPPRPCRPPRPAGPPPGPPGRGRRAARRRAAPRPPRPTSSALPTQRPRGWSIAVTSQRTGRPQGSASAAMSSAASRALATSGKNAPLPAFTSSTMAPAPPASFLLMIEAAMRPAEGTVPVASRSASRRSSPGVRLAAWETTAIPDVPHLAHEAVQRKIGLESGDRLQLVDRAAGVGLPAAAHRGDPHPQRRRQRRGHEGRRVAHAAGGVHVAGRRRATPSSRRSPGGDQRAREAPRRRGGPGRSGTPPCTRRPSARRRPCRRATSARRTPRSRRPRGPRAGFARSPQGGRGTRPCGRGLYSGGRPSR